jgi:peroxiredoxin
MLQINQRAPDFSLPDLGGTTHSLREYLSHVVLINFWSAECPHAARVDGELAADLSVWGSQVILLLIASNINEDPESLRRVAAQRGLPIVLYDAKGTVADLYAALTTPHFFLIDGDGLLRYQGAYDDVTFRQRTARHIYLRQAVQAVLESRNPDPAETAAYGCSIVRYSL